MNMLSSAVPVSALTGVAASGYPDALTVLILVAAVFVLVAIWAIVTMIRFVHKAQGTEQTPAPMPTASPTAPVPTSDASSEDDAAVAAAIGAAIAAQESAVLAAITAAIAVVWESEHPGTGFRVVSYRHVEKPHSAWNAKS